MNYKARYAGYLPGLQRGAFYTVNIQTSERRNLIGSRQIIEVYVLRKDFCFTYRTVEELLNDWELLGRIK